MRNILASDFLIASAKRTTVKILKDDQTDSFSFENKNSKNDLRKDLANAEKLLSRLEGKFFSFYHKLLSYHKI